MTELCNYMLLSKRKSMYFVQSKFIPINTQA
jgi:hypothetical protein